MYLQTISKTFSETFFPFLIPRARLFGCRAIDSGKGQIDEVWGGIGGKGREGLESLDTPLIITIVSIATIIEVVVFCF